MRLGNVPQDSFSIRSLEISQGDIPVGLQVSLPEIAVFVIGTDSVVQFSKGQIVVVLPKAKPAADTYAYSLEEITQMLHVLPEPAATIVAAASFTGVRKGELRGFRWEDFDGGQIRISQSYWRSHVQEPKTKKSKAPVPVISQLSERFELHRELSGNPEIGLMFASPLGTPINLDALAEDVIRPALEKAGLAWHGWHAFRRGLATNLHRLGVPDETIQRILRHSTVAVTQNCYIKTSHADAVSAMRSLKNAPNMHFGRRRRLEPSDISWRRTQ